MSHPQALDAALDLARRGFHVLPGVAGEKRPALKDWQHVATRDEAQIRSWWTDAYAARPVIVPCARYTDPATGEDWKLFVLDLDTKDGKDGVAELAAVMADPIHGGELPRTLTVLTPSGGRHLIFKTHEDLLQPTPWKHGVEVPDIDKPGIDTRAGDRGLIVGAGSVMPAGAYIVEVDAPVAELPAWLASWIGRADTRERARGAIATTPSGETLELDTPRALRRAREYLEHHAPLAIQGSHGDRTTIKVANRVLDFGVSPETALELMDEFWNERCSPPWRRGADGVGGGQSLDDKVYSAAKSRKSAIGHVQPGVDFDAVELAHDDTAKPRTRAPAHPIELLGDDCPDVYPDPLVEGLIDEGAAVLLIGHPKAGKSHAAYAIAHAVATGQSLAGRHVEAGGVLYIQYEGFAGMRARRAALRIKHGPGGKLAFWRASGNILRPEHQQDIVRRIEEAERRLGCRIVLVVVDTVSAAAPGLKQNDAADVSAALEGFKARVLNADRALLLLHHKPKNGDDPAGSFVWKANVDGVLHVEKLTGGARRLVAADMRDHVEGGDLEFRLEPVQVGTTRRGRPMFSAVAIFGAAGDFSYTNEPATPAARSVEAAIRSLLKDATISAVGAKTLRRADVVKAVAIGGPIGGACSIDAASKRVSDWLELHGSQFGVAQIGRKNMKILTFHPSSEFIGAGQEFSLR